MSLAVSSANLYWPDAIPIRLLSHNELSTGNTVTRSGVSLEPGGVIVLGFDCCATDANPVQCFIRFQVPTGQNIYYDSQSTGEGNGVRWQWRGQAPLLPGEGLSVVFSASSSIQWSLNAWGLVLPLLTTVQQ